MPPKMTQIMAKGAAEIMGPYARRMLQQAGLNHQSSKPSTPLVILDNAGGSGVVSAELLATLPQSAKAEMQILCSDIFPDSIDFVKARISDEGWKGAEAKVIDAQKTGLETGTFTHVFTNFGVQSMPDPKAFVAECSRILRPNGLCGLTTWTLAGWFPLAREAFATLPDPPPFPSFREFGSAAGNDESWDDPQHISQTLSQHGFVDVNVQVMENEQSIRTPKDFNEMAAGMYGMIMGKFWSEEDRARCGPLVDGAVEKYLVKRFGEGKPIMMTWVGNVATARKPSQWT